VKQVHPGLKEDLENIDQNRAYGKVTFASDHVGEVMKAQNLNGLADKFNEIKEDKYASHMREPLGQSYSRGYQWPDRADPDHTRFGVPSGRCESAKDLLFPAGGSLEEKPEHAAMYVKTHGNIPAGEQRSRSYRWKEDLEPATHPFGYGEQKFPNGVAKAVHQERHESAFPKTVIVKKTVEDMKAVSQD